MLLTPLATTAQLPESSLARINPERLGLVLIEPIDASFPDHRFLASNESYRVTSVRDTRELALLGAAESFAIALISDTLGRVGFVDAANSVRKQWPTARILVLGRAAVVLEDHLYDDALPHSCGQQELCDTLNRMSRQRVQGRPFIVTTPASEHASLLRRQVSSGDDSRMSNVPERMTQTRSGLGPTAIALP
jgi:hypothetical protein